MKITDVEAIWLQLPTVDDRADGTQDTLVVKVHTDEGIVGVGEVDSSPMAAKAIIEAPLSHRIARGLRLCVIGEDPLDIARLWHAMYEGSIFFGRGGAAQQAISGIDIALWDIAGKALGQPVYRLLGGGFRNRLRAYASILFQETPEATYDLARRLADQGFTAVKFGWGPMGTSEKTDLALVRMARRGLGDHLDLMIDAGICYDTATAIRRAHQFAEYNPFWLEEPLHPDNLEGYSRLAAVSPIRIAAGEQETTLVGFQALLDAGLAVVQPDVARVGGISQAIQIGRMAMQRHRLCVNHSYKTGISIAASLHFLAALPNAPLLEYCVEQSPLRQTLTRETFPVVDGWVAVPQEPGLGITLDEEVIARYRVA
ncbi:mandelate racemase/muconate lactonizing enzyme family protein [Roseiflexus castenholzii]|uniref:Mandelate racemase/muconate lactonizing protein n=1 Tax=Roseiflexus castenholzii (strain DSM 13941 / HLO8) TaxID=383372 RepID=A7NQP6_ROSCS|nr:mandelate racemase/muconate lactonizing enzyme family protein [Roseiflexus castenholzii]ABU59892.1 Mandelate racemase/muconate lactonizing protein [Roseiflexus castenholzii DSM 13941]